jgi:hypothetical protein
MSNYKFETTDIRGKKYISVNERVKFFRQEDEYKNWTISTEFTSLDSEMCVCRAIIADPSQRIIASGHAHEVQGSSNINKTSYVENCETSAIGRALAMMGIGIDVSIASANEVTEAMAKQSVQDTNLKNLKDVLSEPTAKKPAAKKPAAKEPAVSTERDPELMSKVIGYIKSQTDKQKAFDFIMSKKGDQLTEKQVEGIMKFVR